MRETLYLADKTPEVLQSDLDRRFHLGGIALPRQLHELDLVGVDAHVAPSSMRVLVPLSLNALNLFEPRLELAQG
ncbi:hypothetical protein LJR084_001766 [Variovorax sp. LjRoot84]|uniref:hypothetical protein n=1 Tax=Variovorax sp. LjRoot84 TaxID=3342340 RepID=UPI003ECC422F